MKRLKKRKRRPAIRPVAFKCRRCRRGIGDPHYQAFTTIRNQWHDWCYTCYTNAHKGVLDPEFMTELVIALYLADLPRWRICELTGVRFRKVSSIIKTACNFRS